MESHKSYSICSECGNKHGKAKFFATTFHKQKCDWCEEVKSVTSSRNYGYPPLLINKQESQEMGEYPIFERRKGENVTMLIKRNDEFGDYFKASKERFSNETAQESLF